MTSKLRNMAQILNRSKKGMTPFTFGKHFRPDMMHDEANTIAQMDRLAMATKLKIQTTDSIF